MCPTVVFQSLFILLFVNFLSAADDDFDPTSLIIPDDVMKLILPAQCAPGEAWKNESSSGKRLHCVIQKGHLVKELQTFSDDAESIGCAVDKKMIQFIADSYDTESYAANPLYQRAGDDCGFCGHKASCCGVKNAQKVNNQVIKDHPDLKKFSNPFYFESIKTLQCSDQSVQACSMKPLTSAEFDTLAKMQKYLTHIDRSDDCNFAQFGFPEWEEAKNNPAFPAFETMFNKFLCRIHQTTTPRFNCVKNTQTKQCMCCCNNSFPQNNKGKWICVQKNVDKVDKICSNV